VHPASCASQLSAASPCHIGTGRGSPLPHRHGTELTPATSARDWAHPFTGLGSPLHGTGLTPCRAPTARVTVVVRGVLRRVPAAMKLLGVCRACISSSSTRTVGSALKSSTSRRFSLPARLRCVQDDTRHCLRRGSRGLAGRRPPCRFSMRLKEFRSPAKICCCCGRSGPCVHVCLFVCCLFVCLFAAERGPVVHLVPGRDDRHLRRIGRALPFAPIPRAPCLSVAARQWHARSATTTDRCSRTKPPCCAGPVPDRARAGPVALPCR
jgi:hypothetical protein